MSSRATMTYDTQNATISIIYDICMYVCMYVYTYISLSLLYCEKESEMVSGSEVGLLTS